MLYTGNVQEEGHSISALFPAHVALEHVVVAHAVIALVDRIEDLVLEGDITELAFVPLGLLLCPHGRRRGWRHSVPSADDRSSSSSDCSLLFPSRIPHRRRRWLFVGRR